MPSVYTREKLKAYKSLDAYNFVLCGDVQDILFHDYEVQNFVVLRTEVLPSQRQGKKTELYKVWVIVNKTNNCILTANCTCMAGYVTKVNSFDPTIVDSTLLQSYSLPLVIEISPLKHHFNVLHYIR